jgi:multidrug transporter EmrE-like cation transporter
MNAWFLLLLAIALEVTGTFLLKFSEGFVKWHWGVLSILCYSACFWVMAPAMKVLPVGVVYAIWAGVGIVAAAVIGIIAFDEKLSAMQYLCIVLVLIGAVGLRFTTTSA